MKRILFALLLLSAPRIAFAAPGDVTPDPPPKPPVKPDLLQPPPPVSAIDGERPKSPWELSLYGYVRAELDFTTKDDRYDFIGRNNGFVLDAARVGVEIRNVPYAVTTRVSVEAASGELVSPNTPIGGLAVRLRDGFARWDPASFLGIQVGQFKAPWQGEELRGNDDWMFASRAVGVEGVLPGRGFQTPGLQLDRQLGAMLSPVRPIGTGSFGASYYLMVMNGNGPNQLLDDNGHLGLVARAEVAWIDHVLLGVGIYKNDRTVGTLPNLYREDDVGMTADLDVKFGGFELFAAVTRVRTVFPTVGTSARVQLAYWGQAAYRIDLPAAGLFVSPGYRYAAFDPWSTGGGNGFDNFGLQYHTAGVRVGHLKLPIQGWLNYTLAFEQEGRKIDNDRLELLGQVTF